MHVETCLSLLSLFSLVLLHSNFDRSRLLMKDALPFSSRKAKVLFIRPAVAEARDEASITFPPLRGLNLENYKIEEHLKSE